MKPLFKDLIGQLRKLNPPSDERIAFNNLTTNLLKEELLFEGVGKVAASGNIALAPALVSAVKTFNDRANAAANALGLLSFYQRRQARLIEYK